MIRYSILAVTIGSLLIGSCSTELAVKSIDGAAPADSTVSGIPFRIQKRYKVVVYQKVDGVYKPVFEKPETVADQDHLFVLDFNSAIFSKGSVDVSFNEDNTIQQLSVKDSSQVAKAISEIGAQTAAVSNAIDQAQMAAQAAELAREAAKTTETTAIKTKEIEAEVARAAALDAEATRLRLDADASATADQRRKATSDERIAKLVANEKARLAGLAPFFPDVVPGVF